MRHTHSGGIDLCRFFAPDSPGNSVKPAEWLAEGLYHTNRKERILGVKGKSILFIIRTDQKWSKMFLQLNQLPSNQPGVWS